MKEMTLENMRIREERKRQGGWKSKTSIKACRKENTQLQKSFKWKDEIE